MRASTRQYDTPFTLDKSPTKTQAHRDFAFDGKRYSLPSFKDDDLLIVFHSYVFKQHSNVIQSALSWKARLKSKI